MNDKVSISITKVFSGSIGSTATKVVKDETSPTRDKEGLTYCRIQIYIHLKLVITIGAAKLDDLLLGSFV